MILVYGYLRFFRKQSIKVAQAADVAKRTVIESITKGFTVKESLALGKRSYSWYQNAKKRDPEFGRQVGPGEGVVHSWVDGQGLP